MSYLEHVARKAKGQRGKAAEDAVRKVLEGVSARVAEFDFQRNYDARAARGRFPAQTGDFSFFAPGIHGVIEAKEVGHLRLLPSKNMEDTQIAKLWKRQLAGGHIAVVVLHTPNLVWRSVPFGWLRAHAGGPSWDLSWLEGHKSAEEALRASGAFGDLLDG